MKIKKIKWGEIKDPNGSVGYTHCVGESPFGRFLITWKGWKEYEDYDLDEGPCDNPFEGVWKGVCYAADDLPMAKQLVQDKLEELINASIEEAPNA